MLATEAWENGLVLEVLKAGNFMEQVNDRVKSLAAMSNKVLQDTKSLIKRSDQETLQDINTEECKLLLKYLNEDQVLVSLKRNWVPDVVTL